MSKNPDLRIYGVSKIIHEEINNIAKNSGLTLSDFMKPELRKIVERFPERYRKPYKEIIMSDNASVEDKAKMIAQLCEPCNKETWNKIYKNAIEVLKK